MNHFIGQSGPNKPTCLTAVVVVGVKIHVVSVDGGRKTGPSPSWHSAALPDIQITKNVVHMFLDILVIHTIQQTRHKYLEIRKKGNQTAHSCLFISSPPFHQSDTNKSLGRPIYSPTQGWEEQVHIRDWSSSIRRAYIMTFPARTTQKWIFPSLQSYIHFKLPIYQWFCLFWPACHPVVRFAKVKDTTGKKDGSGNPLMSIWLACTGEYCRWVLALAAGFQDPGRLSIKSNNAF